MDSQLASLDFIDTLSERHLQLRKTIEKLWNDTSDITLSNSEWFIISKIYKKQPTIAEVTKAIDITRQATHKFIKSLEAKGIVEIRNVENNKKVKSVRLTALGEECYEKNKAIKDELESKISNQIGIKNLIALKEILKMDWGFNKE